MINKEKWINSLPNAGLKYNEEINQLIKNIFHGKNSS